MVRDGMTLLMAVMQESHMANGDSHKANGVSYKANGDSYKANGDSHMANGVNGHDEWRFKVRLLGF